MGCTLYWKQEVLDGQYICSHMLRDILEKKYGFPSILGFMDRDYLEALEDAGIEGASDLIEAINKYKKIKIYKEC